MQWNSKVSGVQPCKLRSYQKLCTKALPIPVPFATTYLCGSGSSSLLHLKTSARIVGNAQMICAWLLVIVCQGMSEEYQRSSNKNVTKFVPNNQ